MSRDPLNRDTFSTANLEADDFESLDAVNDEQYGKQKPSKGDTLRARRQVEAWLEERNLKRAIEDDWND
ncbi:MULTISPECIES: PA3496 family putative envelope integrity protein [unclassified Vreelandella]